MHEKLFMIKNLLDRLETKKIVLGFWIKIQPKRWIYNLNDAIALDLEFSLQAQDLIRIWKSLF